MKKKNRDINIFSMSALDLFASAMGAFLLIAVMALPYYLKTDKDLMQKAQELKKQLIQRDDEIRLIKQKLKEFQNKNEELKKKLAKCEEQINKNKELKKKLAKCEKEKNKIKSRNTSMQKKLSKTFCVINMSWESSKTQDIDMYIKDPNGRTYYFSNRKYSDSDAMFTVDSKNVKNGAEVWITPKLEQGSYKIYYKYYAGSGSVNVNTKIFTKSFTKDLPSKRMRNPGSGSRKVHIATVNVDSSGNATLEVR
jgi:regulator of replication initiation timing